MRLFAPHRWTSVEHTRTEKGMGIGILDVQLTSIDLVSAWPSLMASPSE
ncbi:hypothetical protein RMSM_06619 [Rhodopirellula maiorica SM1]|uniref:Uncharacterized protein n=1 Tax=Rhodopirellula maiorica SM1 TaxID=1265738 RepID=M5RBL9_9BACT|nr:hypothetical protein RMSM_06619 [Rhodopirellula maiorica SM1]